MRRILTLAGALLVGLLLILMQRDRQNAGPNAGEVAETNRPAPAFKLNDLAGNPAALEDFKGKVVMLDFWATWCGPCRMTMPVLEELQQEHPNEFTLLAVNVGEPPDVVIPYVKRRKIQSRVLLDLDGITATAYGAAGIPMQVIIDKEGIVRFIQQGYYAGMKEDLWAEIRKLQ